MDAHPNRTEDDLRAAFALAAQEAPSTQDVLAKLAAAEVAAVRPARRAPARRWLPIAAAAVVVLAIGVPITIVASSHHDNAARSASASAAVGGFAAGGSAGSNEGKAAAPQVAGGDAGSATGGPINTSPGYLNPLTPNPSAGRVCTPDDLAIALAWTKSGTGLTGLVKVSNHTTSACDLAVKPAVYPLSSDGNRLVENIATAEGYVGPQRLLPGASATSTITWRSYCESIPSNRAEIDWGAGVATITVAPGPTFPPCVAGVSDTAAAISSTWFSPLA